MSLRGELRKAGFGEKLESYFTRLAYRDIRYNPIEIDQVKKGFLLRHRSDQAVISDNTILSFREILSELIPNNIKLGNISIIAVSTLYEHVFCVSCSVSDFKTVILLKESSLGRCFIKSNLDMISDCLSKSDKESNDQNKLPKTQRDFKWMQRWFDIQNSLS